MSHSTGYLAKSEVILACQLSDAYIVIAYHALLQYDVIYASAPACEVVSSAAIEATRDRAENS